MHWYALLLSNSLMTKAQLDCGEVETYDCRRFASMLNLPKIIVIVGDSHAVAFTDSRYEKNINFKFFQFHQMRYLFISLWFRDTLAYQISSGQFPPEPKRALAWLRKLRFIGASYVFCFGEIDVRCHLVDIDKSKGFMDAYVTQCSELVRAKPERIAFITPTPPSDFYEDHPSYPRNGTISERVIAHNAFCASLKGTVLNQSFIYIDTRDSLTNEFGGLRREYTQDGCHLNAVGSSVVRVHVLNSWI